MAKISFVVSSLAILVACGGDGGSSSSVSATYPSGLAAVGAPISSGTLSALDVNGRAASTAIANDGTYTIEFLNSLQPPVLLRAEGVSGGRSAVHFGVITNSTETTVNVTPISTAIVAQVLQADPGLVFETADVTKIAQLTSSRVGAANTILANALSSARSAAGLSTNLTVNFLNTPFDADKTGLDKLLDLVKVSVQPDLSVQLKNKISDGVTTITSSGSVSGTLGTIQSIDTKSIDALGQSLQAAFQNGAAPWQNSTQTVISLFSNNFLHGGNNAAQMISEIARDADDMVGAKFLPAKILNCKTSGALPICDVLFTVMYSDGGFEPFIFPVRLEGGSWKIYGDQAPVYTEYGAVVYRTVTGNNSINTRSGFNITVYDDAVINNVRVGYIKVWFGTSTSGTPEFVFVNPARVGGSCNGNALGGYLQILTDSSNNNTCAGNFAELSNAKIDQLRSTFATTRPTLTVGYYDTSNVSIPNAQHTITIEALPLKPTEVSDKNFAVISNSSWSAFDAADLNQQFTLSVVKGSNVGLEDIVGAGPLGSSLSSQNLSFSTVRTGSSWNALKANSYLVTITRDSDGRMYWYQRMR